MKTITKLWIGLAILILLSPLGLILPARFAADSAWGEWSTDEIQKLVGYMPQGMAKHIDRWVAPMPDYALKGQKDASLHSQSGSYILSGVIGVLAVVGVTLLIGKLVAKHGDSDPA